MASYLGRGGFRSWPEAWVRDYVEGGMRERADGQVELACAPAWESATFAATEHDPWRHVRRLEQPVTLMVGHRGSTCGPDSVARFRRLRPDLRLVEIPEASHFLPMEHPDRVAAEIRRRCGLDRADAA